MPPFLFVVFPDVECKIEQSCPRVCKNMEFSVRTDKNYDELCVCVGGGARHLTPRKHLVRLKSGQTKWSTFQPVKVWYSWKCSESILSAHLKRSDPLFERLGVQISTFSALFGAHVSHFGPLLGWFLSFWATLERVWILASF